MGKTLAERCAALELFVLDVDGVLTDGGIHYDDAGREHKTFHVRDGAAIRLWERAGKQSAIITGRQSPVVETRAADVGVAHVLQGVTDKAAALRQLLDELRLRPEQICCIGDDVLDVPMMRLAGLAVVPADACPEAVQAAHYVSRFAGGCGAVREVMELVMRCQGIWPRSELAV